MAITLYAARGGGSAIVEALLTLTGQEYRVEYFSWEDLPNEELLAVNPLGEIPALRLDNGDLLTETAAITLWLGDRFPASKLVPPADDPVRVQFLRRLVWLVAAVYPTFTYGDHPERFVPDKTDAVQLRETTDLRRQALWRQLEKETGGPWICGGRRTALDIFIAVMSCWRPRRQWFAAECPQLFAIAQRVDQLDTLKKVWSRNRLPQT
ncbi:glutathione S-transferase family protein [Microbulbifer taiwanensis]|uniref:Glutathione S-transferase family protein n=1 Tax=Microbulbifer taiwanensis TaxID=986746 RepID=A0ABW1YP76_9GAMM|nr:glutathione S-transferase family protein [Microbulbifer taiwanensis]